MKIFNTSKIQSKINQSSLLKVLIYHELCNEISNNNNTIRLASLVRRFVFVSERLSHLNLLLIDCQFKTL